jgi:hypothetical protein
MITKNYIGTEMGGKFRKKGIYALMKLHKNRFL